MATSVDKASVVNQIQTMNAVYNSVGLNLVLTATTLTVNDAWSIGAGSDLDAAKQALRQGTYADLNLYFHTNLTGGILGTCTLPTSVPSDCDPVVYASDGCNIHAGTMPGGSTYGYNSGLTAVHEAGHWFGLLHTFEGDSCSGDGDFIADTRQESVSTSGCPTSPAKNSCPDLPGNDPIHNYMDYSIDACYEAFTSLQEERMHDLWQAYRQGH
ncbi:hypothetical protein AMS68_002022 [Peltaster fructicola]|uniref:Peptidase M43 pregnancy-associated plasma-A domain-containing protein n=1 Tax=Peltaster fructicola TaxID=286661 RepID=A0A6H0XPE5_9PEZI|nr:hypothetical protein AMS68_002022 [Peltaster fructicola]